MTYAYLPDAVINAWPKLSPSAKAVAVALASFMNGKGECWPGVKALLERSGLRKPQTVADAVAELERMAVVNVQWRARRARVFSWAKVPPDGTNENAGERHNRETESAVARHPKMPLRGTGNNTKNNTTSSRHASHAGAKAKRGASRKTPGPPVWGWWVDANREAGPDPLRIGPDLGAARELGKAVTRGELTESELRGCMALYLADDDTWLVKQGHALRHLAGRIGAYRARVKELEPPPMDPAEIDRIEADAAESEREKA
jgi:hypothetical protein